MNADYDKEANEYMREHLLGKVFTKVSKERDTAPVHPYTRGGDELVFRNGDGAFYFHHYQDCCERVRIEEIHGDLDDLRGAPLLQAEQSSSIEHDGPGITWTFYKFATIRGSVTVRWCGESNGYYSEEVDMTWVPRGEQ